MKNRIRTIATAITLTAVLFTACSKDNDNHNTGMYTISGNAAGTQVVPAVAGNGTATISGTYNANTGQLNYTSNWNNLSGAPTAGGFYTGAVGASGTAITPRWAWGSDLTGSGSITGSSTLTADQASQLMNGNMYYSIGTATNATGEVRGQMTATAMP